MRHTLLVLLLFAMHWMAVKLVVPPLSCCRTVSKNTVPIENLESYWLHIGCHIKAVKFTTKTGKYICSDPDSTWARNAMMWLNQPPIPSTSLSTTTPKTPVTTKPTTSKSVKTTTVLLTLPTSTTKEPPTTIIYEPNVQTLIQPIPTTFTTYSLPMTTINPQQTTTTPGTTKRTSTEASVTTHPAQFESTANTLITTSTHTPTSKVKAARPPRITQPPVQKTDPTTADIPITHPRSSTALTHKRQNLIFHKEPWTDRRLKKKKRSGLRKKQRTLKG